MRARSRIARGAAVVALTAGCLGPVASLYPPAPDAPVERVWVVDHGWHAGLVLARSSIPPGLLPEQDDFPAAQYLEFGWGDADFYQTRDAGVALAIRAAVLSKASVLHVVGLPTRPKQVFATGDVVEVRLSRPGFEALVRFVDGSFDREGQRAASPRGPGLYGDSAFYSARGRYHLLYTCNTWIADALRAGGLPITPVYAMTAGNLMWQVSRLPKTREGG
jgi:uncharacterized protein (TIGR02117 family)